MSDTPSPAAVVPRYRMGYTDDEGVIARRTPPRYIGELLIVYDCVNSDDEWVRSEDVATIEEALTAAHQRIAQLEDGAVAQPVHVARETLRSTLRTEAGHIAYVDDEIDALVVAVRAECRQDAEAALTAAQEARQQAEQWQPIDTAPKDGTWVLVCGCNGSPLVLVAGYRVEANRQSYPQDRWVAWGNIRVEPPTHWMPLPPSSRGPTQEGTR